MRKERGAAVVDFVLIMVLLIPIVLGVLQVGLVMHVRNTLAAAASEGARSAAAIDADPADQPQFVVEGVRLLRSGGAIVVHRAALGGRAGDANANDAEVAAVREAARLIAEDERLTPVLIPLGDGLLAAARD